MALSAGTRHRPTRPGRPSASQVVNLTTPESHLAPRAVIVNPEKHRAAQNLSLIAAVLLTRGIAPINK